MNYTPLIIGIFLLNALMPTQLYATHYPTHVADSLLHVTGARGWLPCNDGSLVGAYINCGNLNPILFYPDYCSQPVVSRSWDGGVTWIIERSDAPDYSYSKMVRLRRGLLLSPHNRWFGRFNLSTDGGRSWNPAFDSTFSDTAFYGEHSGQLFRDHRGILYWIGRGFLYYSLDNGASRSALTGQSLWDWEVYYVLPPNGLMVLRMLQTGSASSEIIMSFNHGRTFVTTATESGTMDINGFEVANDTPTISTAYFAGFPLPRFVGYSTEYWNEQQRKWEEGRYRGECWYLGAMLDSNDAWYGWSPYGFYRTKAGDSACVRIVWATYDSTKPKKRADTLLPVMKATVEGMFYDLDGNVHPNGSDIVVSTNDSRPISRIDRLYYCNGIEYVIGGRNLDALWLEPSRSQNAILTYTITPNKRLATIEVNAIDTALPMYFSLLVEDSQLGQQRFVDSLIPNGVIPKLKVLISNDDGTAYRILCDYPDGPYVWYKDGIPWQIPGYYIGTVYSDSVIKWPMPGRYKVKGRNNNGCDVFSEEVSIGITDVAADDKEAGNHIQVVVTDNEIRIRNSDGATETISVAVFDLLGNALNVDVFKAGNEFVIQTDTLKGIVAVVLTDSRGNQARRIVLVQ